MPEVPDSVLDSVKKSLDIAPEVEHFDSQIIMHTNAAFALLQQLGAGPVLGFMIEDNTETWSAFEIDRVLLNSVKQFIYFKVRLAFDPPATSFAISAIQEQIKEHTWYITQRAGSKIP